jgi:uncharacterized protein YndB with AHSA1/START domain
MSIKIDYSTTANCRPEHLWRVIEDLSRWPRFDPEAITSARWTHGEPWQPGSKFELRLQKPTGITLIPEVVHCEPPIILQIKAGGAGVKGEAVFVFKILPHGQTEMRTVQEFSGAPLFLLGDKIKRGVEMGVTELFGRLKAEAEAESQNLPGVSQT